MLGGGVGGADLGQACHGPWLHDGSCRFERTATDLIIHPRSLSVDHRTPTIDLFAWCTDGI